ncbi:MAG: alpha/beta hydrolase [Pseudomonadota bacterium]|nr:alpha/beta hydrolase [Pseudomonadota bacterium]
MKRRHLLALVGLGLAAIGFASCSTLTTFDTLVPKDGGVMVAARDVAFGPDQRQRLDVYRPVAAARDLPIIVFFYGGSWQSGSKNGYSWLAKALAARGFVVVIPDYRLHPAVRYPMFLEDNAAAVRWTIANAKKVGGDPARLVLAGHSAGAYNAAMLAYDPRWLGAEQKQVHGFVGLAGPYDFLPFDTQVTRDVFGAAPDLQSTQPVNYIDAGDPPAFLGTGDTDTTVRPRNSDRLAAKLEAAGIAVERKRYAKIGHIGILTALAKPFRGRAPVLDDVAAFATKVTR